MTNPKTPETWWTLTTVVGPDGRICHIQKNDDGCTRVVLVAGPRTRAVHTTRSAQ